jgi:hypothetical protein
LTENQIKDSIFLKEREEKYVDSLLEEMKPKFSILPEPQYKIIVGLVDPTNLNGVSEKWKEIFKVTYGHTILEDKIENLNEETVLVN